MTKISIEEVVRLALLQHRMIVLSASGGASDPHLDALRKGVAGFSLEDSITLIAAGRLLEGEPFM